MDAQEMAALADEIGDDPERLSAVWALLRLIAMAEQRRGKRTRDPRRLRMRAAFPESARTQLRFSEQSPAGDLLHQLQRKALVESWGWREWRRIKRQGLRADDLWRRLLERFDGDAFLASELRQELTEARVFSPEPWAEMRDQHERLRTVLLPPAADARTIRPMSSLWLEDLVRRLASDLRAGSASPHWGEHQADIEDAVRQWNTGTGDPMAKFIADVLCELLDDVRGKGSPDFLTRLRAWRKTETRKEAMTRDERGQWLRTIEGKRENDRTKKVLSAIARMIGEVREDDLENEFTKSP
ncbi:MAG: hypothetical protein IT186_12670 [Acidobacteria bacterium]|nr:hypothetical protein [Acidobacteriota bacterium]